MSDARVLLRSGVKAAAVNLACGMNWLRDWNGRDLVDLLSLRQLATDRFANRFAHRNQSGAVFGGQLIGQAMMSALLTLAGENPGPALLPREFSAARTRAGASRIIVERTRDGRNFSHRRVVVYQEDQSIFTAELSFHDGETGDDHAHSLPFNVPAPDLLPSRGEIVLSDGHRLPPAVSKRMVRARAAVDVRIVNFEALISRKSSDEAVLYWLRVVQPLPNDPLWHAAALG